MTAENPQNGRAEEGFSFSDKRRVDPDTGEVRDQGAAGAAGQDAHGQGAAGQGANGQAAPGRGADGQGASGQDADAQDLGVEIPDDASELDVDAAPAPQSDEAKKYLDDLQRLNAEYASYRRRSARDQDQAREAGRASFAEALIPVLDEVKLAEENGHVTDAFAGHVQALESALEKAGFVQFGEVGEEFDPNFHEALMQQPSEDVSEPTVFAVMQPGYRLGDRVLRPARVGVHLPAD